MYQLVETCDVSRAAWWFSRPSWAEENLMLAGALALGKAVAGALDGDLGAGEEAEVVLVPCPCESLISGCMGKWRRKGDLQAQQDTPTLFPSSATVSFLRLPLPFSHQAPPLPAHLMGCESVFFTAL